MDIEDIRARVDAATPGPWTIETKPLGIEGAALIFRPIPPEQDVLADIVGAWRGQAAFAKVYNDNYVEDAWFLAHARADVSALLDEVERLRGIIAAARTKADRVLPDPVLEELKDILDTVEAS